MSLDERIEASAFKLLANPAKPIEIHKAFWAGVRAVAQAADAEMCEHGDSMEVILQLGNLLASLENLADTKEPE